MMDVKEAIKAINKINYKMRHQAPKIKLDGLQGALTILLTSAADVIDEACKQTGWSRSEMFQLIGVIKNEAKED